MTTILDFTDFQIYGSTPREAFRYAIRIMSDLQASDRFVTQMYGAKSFSSDLNILVSDMITTFKAMEKESDF